MQKKLLAILLTLCMLLGMFPFAIMAEETTGEVVDDTTPTESENGEDAGSGDGVTDTTVVNLTDGIDNEAELLALMADSSLWDGDYVLNADIVLSEGSKQAPIGNLTTAFSGTFDGQTHSITGVNLTATEAVVGLFGAVVGGTIQNLKVGGTVTNTDATSAQSDSKAGTGLVVGLLMGASTVSNVVTLEESIVNGGTRTGGIVGTIWGPSGSTTVGGVASGEIANIRIAIQNCENNATVSGTGTGVGGIVGVARLGGPTATLVTGGYTISNCVNKGAVSSGAWAAGIIGYSFARSLTINLTDLVNSGAVSATGVRVGALCASFVIDGASAADVNIENVKNTADISCGGTGGGLIGYMATTNAKAISDISISNVYIGGTFTLNGSYGGGLIGYVDARTYGENKFTINNAHVAADVTINSTGTDYIAGMYGYGLNVPPIEATNWLFTGKLTNNATEHKYTGAIAAVPRNANFTNAFWQETTLYGTLAETAGTAGTNTIVGIDSGAGNKTNVMAISAIPEGKTISDYLTAAEDWTALLDGTVELSVFHTCVDEKNNETTEDGADGLCDTCGANLVCDHEGTERTTKVNTAATCNSTGLDDVYCSCGEYLETVVTEKDPDNHATTTVSAKANGEKIDLYADCCEKVLFTVDAINEIYVDQANGVTLAVSDTDVTGIGTSAKPFADLEDAMEFAAAATAGADGVTVYINGVYEMSESVNTTACNEMITLSGVTGSSADSIQISNDKAINLNGPTTIKDIKIDNQGTTYIAAQGNKLVIDTGVATNYDSSHKVYVVGGYSYAYYPPENWTYHNDVTVRSGEYHIVTANDRFINRVGAGGDSTITLGATGDDSLIIHSFYPHSVNYIKAASDSKVTVIVDGNVTIDSFVATNGNSDAVSTDVKFDIDFVVYGTVAAAPKFSVATTATGTVTVYADADVDTLYANFATKNGTTVDKKSLAAYCLNVLKKHTDDDEDKFCDLCKADLSVVCEHPDELLTFVSEVAATCNTVAVTTYNCKCSKTVVKEGTEFDATNHANNTNFVWAKNTETGEYYIDCSVCENNIVAEEPTVYVNSANGDDANNGFTADTAVATLVEAVNRIVATGGTVCFTDKYDLAGKAVDLPEWGENTIKFTSMVDGNGRPYCGIANTADSVAHLSLGGDSIFDYIFIWGANKQDKEHNGEIRFIANWHDLELGEYIRVGHMANTMIIAGHNGITADDTTPADVKVTLHGVGNTTTQKDADGNTIVFYDVIYLGSTLSAGDLTVKDKKVTLNILQGYDKAAGNNPWQAKIDDLYLSSSSANTKTVTLENCETTVNQKNESYVLYLRKGNATENNAWLQKATYNLMDDSTFGEANNSYQASFTNVEETIVNISDREGTRELGTRTKPISSWFGFYGYNNDEKQEAATAVINYGCGSHSRAETINNGFTRLSSATASIGVPALSTKDENGNIRQGIVDAITLSLLDGAKHVWGDGEVTTLPAAGEAGEKTYTCANCSKTKTEVEPWDCEDYGHNYVATADGIACTYCDVAYTAGAAEISIDATSVAAGESVTVPVKVATTVDITAASFTIDLPAGLTMTAWEDTLTSTETTEDALNSGWQILGSDPDENGAYTMPYMFALLYLGTEEVEKEDGTTETVLGDAMLNQTVAVLTLTADETFNGGVISVNVDEVYNANEDAIKASALSAEVTVETAPVAGDVNDDGAVTIVDALLILKAVLNETKLDNADVTADGELTFVDVIRVLNIIAK